MALPRGKRHGYWLADSGAERDAITAGEGLLQGDMCSINGVVWHWTGVSWVVEGGGTSARYISIADLGAVVGGDAGDNADAFQAAIDQCAASAVYSTVLIPGRTGVWNMDHEVQMKSGVRVLGEGPNSRISFVGAAGSFSHDGDIWAEGSAAQIEALNADSNEGDRDITLASAPSAVAGDLVLLYDPTDSSWDAHSVHQRSGEFAEVERISGNDIVTVGARIDTYLSSSPTEVHIVTPVTMTFENVSIIGRGVDTKAVLWIDYGRDIEFVNCKITNGGGHGLWLSRCFHVHVVGGELSRFGNAFETHDACRVEHCQEVLFRDCDTSNTANIGSCIRVHGADVEKTGAFPSRLVRVEGGKHETEEVTLNFRRHSDLCEIVGAVCDGGLSLSGGRHTVSGTRVHGFDGDAIDASDQWHYFSFTVQDCVFSGNPNDSSVRGIFARSIDDDDIDRRSNAIIIRNNKFIMDEAGSSNPAIEIFLNGDIGPRRIVVEDNEIIGDDAGNDYLIDIGSGNQYGTGGAVLLEDVSISGNKISDGGIHTYLDCPTVTIEGNKITEAIAHAISSSLPGTGSSANQTTHIKNNTVYNCALNFVHLVGWSVSLTRALIAGNSVHGFGSGTDNDKVPVYVSQCDSCSVQGNVFAGGNGDNVPACYMANVADLYWGGNSFPGLGTGHLIAPPVFTVTNFFGDTWTNNESLKAFTQNDRHITWGTDKVSTEAAISLAKIAHSHDTWLMEIRVIATNAITSLDIKIYFFSDGSPQVTSANLSGSANEWLIYRPLLFIPKNTDVRVSLEGGPTQGDASATVTWLNVGLGGGEDPEP